MADQTSPRLTPLYFFFSKLLKVWVKLGDTLGFINTRIILTLIFFTIILPMGIIMRLIGKLNIQNKMNSKAESYFKVSKERPAKHMENPY